MQVKLIDLPRNAQISKSDDDRPPASISPLVVDGTDCKDVGWMRISKQPGRALNVKRQDRNHRFSKVTLSWTSKSASLEFPFTPLPIHAVIDQNRLLAAIDKLFRAIADIFAIKECLAAHRIRHNTA
jgi:hypothetical protein